MRAVLRLRFFTRILVSVAKSPRLQPEFTVRLELALPKVVDPWNPSNPSAIVIGPSPESPAFTSHTSFGPRFVNVLLLPVSVAVGFARRSQRLIPPNVVFPFNVMN